MTIIFGYHGARNGPGSRARAFGFRKGMGSIMRQWLYRNYIHLGLLVAWLVVGGAMVLLTDRRELHLFQNAFNVYGNDTFFQCITYMGDRQVAWLVGLAVCFNELRRSQPGLRRRLDSMRKGGTILCATIGAGLATECLKYVSGPVPRPVALFGEPTPLYLVPEFTNTLYNSMPSGHAAIAFALWTSIAQQYSSRWTQLLCFIVALFAAYSRVYLSEHFFGDIYAGSVVGIVCALIAHAVLRPFATGAADDELQ